jgi:hypothetical protein
MNLILLLGIAFILGMTAGGVLAVRAEGHPGPFRSRR